MESGYRPLRGRAAGERSARRRGRRRGPAIPVSERSGRCTRAPVAAGRRRRAHRAPALRNATGPHGTRARANRAGRIAARHRRPEESMIRRADEGARPARQGTALIAALQFLAVLALMVAGSLYVVRGSRRASDLLLHDARLTGAADAALARELAMWDGTRRARQPIGSRDSDSASVGRGAALRTTVAIVRL